MTAKTNDALNPPVTEQELADFAALPTGDDPAVNGVLIAATSMVVRFLERDLVARDWVLTLWDWPYVGTRSFPEVSRRNSYLSREIALPFANLLSVDSVELYGQQVTNFIKRDDSIILPEGAQFDRYKDNTDPAIRVSYRAGYGESTEDVPEAVRQAILMMVALMYETRGDCDASQALIRSGASEVLAPFVSPRKMAVM